MRDFNLNGMEKGNGFTKAGDSKLEEAQGAARQAGRAWSRR